MANQKRGRQSFILSDPPVITHWASVAGKKESEGPLAHTFDIKSQDTYFGQKTWEQGEKQMQKLALGKLAEKANMKLEDFDLVFSGDLLNQCIGSSFTLRNLGIPHLAVRCLFHHGGKSAAVLHGCGRRFRGQRGGHDLIPFCLL